MSISKEKKSVLFLALIVVIILVIGAVIALSLRTDPIAENLENDQVIKAVFVMNDGKNNVLSTDVFVYYPVSQKGALFDILGNTGAIYESLGRVDRIDAIYTEKGMDTYRKEIEKLTGLSIPFSFEISLQDFGILTDKLGGMKVFVPSPVDALGPSGERWLLPSGAVTLDGDKIQTYIQYMLPDENDDDVDERRQNVIISFFTAIKENQSVILEKKNFQTFLPSLKANMKQDSLYRFFEHISNVDSERLTPQTITGSLRTVDGKKLLFPYYDGQLIKDVVKQTMNSLVSTDATMQSRIYVIDIQNGTTVQGLARNTSALLQSVGYDVLEMRNADRNDYEDTLIINHIGNKEVAKALGDFIRCTNIEDEEIKPESAGVDSAADVDFTIILGKDFDGRYVISNNKKELKQNKSESPEDATGTEVKSEEQ